MRIQLGATVAASDALHPLQRCSLRRQWILLGRCGQQRLMFYSFVPAVMHPTQLSLSLSCLLPNMFLSRTLSVESFFVQHPFIGLTPSASVKSHPPAATEDFPGRDASSWQPEATGNSAGVHSYVRLLPTIPPPPCRSTTLMLHPLQQRGCFNLPHCAVSLAVFLALSLYPIGHHLDEVSVRLFCYMARVDHCCTTDRLATGWFSLSHDCQVDAVSRGLIELTVSFVYTNLSYSFIQTLLPSTILEAEVTYLLSTIYFV